MTSKKAKELWDKREHTFKMIKEREQEIKDLEERIRLLKESLDAYNEYFDILDDIIESKSK